MIFLHKFLFVYPVIGRLTLFVLVPIVVGVTCFWMYLLKSLPVKGGIIDLENLQHEVVINRDKYSIPTILAQNDKEAIFALGYAHAQDRLWQMEIARRTVSGRISEVIGSKGLGSDVYMRTLGLYKDTKMLWENLEPETQGMITAYVDGVNASIKNYAVLPPEYIYFNTKPEPWTVYDSLAIIESMAWLMSGNYSNEIKRITLLAIFGRAKALDFMPEVSSTELNLDYSYLNNNEAISEKNIAALNSGIDSLGMGKSFAGSNNWVVAGHLSATGAPLLASDPHLQTGAPSVWYIASIKGAELDVSGATFPGFPFVILGHNNSIGWGITNMGADVQDIRLEKIDLSNPEMYIKDGIKKNILTRTETIKIKPDFLKKDIAPVLINIRETENGPIISDITGGGGGSAYSISWVGKLGLAGSVDSFRKINYANDWESFRHALRGYTVPAQNFVYADTKGNIGYLGAGKIPVRKKGNGSFPVPGWTSEYDWKAYIPFEELPQSYNPTSGVIATANNKIVSDIYPYHITSDWAPSYRVDRINEIINKKTKAGLKLSVNDFRVMQGDTVSLAAKRILPFLTIVHSDIEKEKKALEYIAKWNSDTSIDSVAASIFESWVKNFNRLLLEDEIDLRLRGDDERLQLENIIDNPNYDFLVDVLKSKKLSWCDYKTTAIVETCNEVLLLALKRTITELEAVAGSDMDAWRWGSVHKIQYSHYSFSESDYSPSFPYGDNKVLHFFAHRHAESGGDENTINIAPASGKDGKTKFQQFWAATYRQVIDLSEINKSLFVVSPGESGNLLSAHYDDLQRAYQNSLLISIGGTKEINSTIILK